MQQRHRQRLRGIEAELERMAPRERGRASGELDLRPGLEPDHGPRSDGRIVVRVP